MKMIKAWWWRDKVNLGDVLTPYIIQKLSGDNCQHIGVKWDQALEYILKRLYARLPINWNLISPIYFLEPEYILGIGSILAHENIGNAIAWGSGFIRKGEKFKGKKVTAVRGKYSDEELQKQGFPQVGVYGDPALLLPMIHPCTPSGKGKVAIVPNFSEYEKFKNLYGDNFDVIDLNTDDIEGTIAKICSYSYILSTSLHGLIVSHAYGVPAIWIEDQVLVGDSFHFKYRDYFSSVGIEYYEPYRNINEILSTDIKKFFAQNKEKYTLTHNLRDIQDGLLKAAPFDVIPEFLHK